MRLWHYKLISVLPTKQLVGQWRELNSIYKKQDKHILINYIYEYPKEDLLLYSNLILDEFNHRNYKYNLNNFNNYFKNISISAIKIPFINKMNDRYLKQCLYNLQEKYDCNGITKIEWDRILNRFKYFI